MAGAAAGTRSRRHGAARGGPVLLGLRGLLGLLAVLGGALVCTGSAHAVPAHAVQGDHAPRDAPETSAFASASGSASASASASGSASASASGSAFAFPFAEPGEDAAEDQPGCQAPRAADVRPSAVPLRTASGSQVTAPVLVGGPPAPQGASDAGAAAPPARAHGAPGAPSPVQLCVLRV